MKRRKFIASGAALGVMGYSPLVRATSEKLTTQSYIELIHYTLFTGEKKHRVRDFYRDVATKALNKIGISPVGVFDVKYGENSPSLYVLLQHDSLESFAAYPEKLMEDKNYVKNGKAFLEAPLSDPSYVRKESRLFRAFKNMPEVEAPGRMVGKDHILEMRIYESHSYSYGQKKIHMFNEGGEIEIFKKTDLNPVFFGEAISGPSMPNLTYMLAFENMEARDNNWKTFAKHPDWKKLSKDPYYKDTVSNITDIILRPLPFSQI